MAKSNAISAMGTLIQQGNGATPEVFTTIAEVVDFSDSGVTREFVDTTHMESPDDTREFLPVLKTAGPVTFNVNLLPATHVVLLNDINNATERNYQVVFSDVAETTWGFTAIVETCVVSGAVGDKLKAAVTLRLTGSRSFA